MRAILKALAVMRWNRQDANPEESYQYPIFNIQHLIVRRHLGIIAVLGILGAASRVAYAQVPPDRILLRHEREWIKGRLVAETRQGYQFIDERGMMRVVPREAVALLDWADPAKGAAFAELDKMRSWAGLKESASVVFLPTPAFGKDLVAGVAKAQRYIHVLAYNMQGDTASQMTGAFFNTLREKAAAGVEVVIILEFGPGTNPRTKNTVKNFASSLSQSGIQVLFMQDYKVQHKKVVLVDNETVWLGSANLTLNALAYNEEMSLRTSDREVARQAAADYAEMRKRASRDAQ
ncbi:MAG: phospholipase D-like domain-containing protein [Kiritimatiellia bacterium]|jgi:hypothetical protein